MISISEIAGKQITAQATKRGKPNSLLRIGIRGGGCTGFSYVFEWEDGEPKEAEHVFVENGGTIVVDPKSYIYLKGTTLDYVVSLMGEGFKLNNPNAKGECGCGESVQF